MKLSVVYSIYNRSELFKRGLATITKQVMDPQDFELVVVDDSSTEDIYSVLQPYIGKLNIRHIKYDHTKSPIWAELNPDGVEKVWYHTQGISANIGINQAQGEVVCISQPEMLHSPWSLYTGYRHAMNGNQVFGEVILASHLFNEFLEANDWQAYSFDSLLEIANNFKKEYEFSHQPPHWYEMYWYIQFFKKEAAIAINGVDLQYQKGVYAEDDQFKMRLRMANYPEYWAGRPECSGRVHEFVVGIHQSHLNESHPRQVRDNQHWNNGSEHNRKLLAEFQQSPYTIANPNMDDVWGDTLITENNYYSLKEANV